MKQMVVFMVAYCHLRDLCVVQIKRQTSTLVVFVSKEQRMAASTDWVCNFVFCNRSFVFPIHHNDYNLKQNFEGKKNPYQLLNELI
uniref:Secreted protein n=1 Tax=Poecilia reticulata TaxID=8081 RepID=A0A3P9NII9_POERE